ncbi:MFS transporter [Pseudonocardia sp. C8]|uniref:MFS transporter n=1 Tax=Pseudonocardia sp. C8 TaxID=2762759 RepID=UPI001642DD38|nr:MFS transporter [Pseudonocardia sp. C8]MBC3191853.1 MFS transporter [Pseudonocardia sp. C8]
MTDDRTVPAPTTRTSPPTRPGRTRALFTACVGNALEWFDWLIYAQFAALLSLQFFPAGDRTAALLGTLAIFGVGFFFRPLGGVVLAALADRHGRRTGLVVSMLLMASGAVLIGAAPTYEQVGLAAPAVLLLARALQGMSTGGEFAGVATYLAEYAPTDKRGRYGSLLYISANLGALAAIGTSLALTGLLGQQQLASWGWRIPFLLGGALGLVALVLRRRMAETEAFRAVRPGRNTTPARQLLRRHPGAVVRLFVLSGLTGVWYYTFASYLPVHLRSQGMPAAPALTAGIIALVVMTVALPFIGALSDRHGRRAFVLAFGAAVAVGAVPLFAVLQPTFVSQVLVQTTALLVFACYAAIGPTVMAEQFPTEVRAVGSGLPYGLGVALFGGTAPLLIEWLTSKGLSGVFPWYLAVLGAVTVVAVIPLRDRRDTDMRAL